MTCMLFMSEGADLCGKTELRDWVDQLKHSAMHWDFVSLAESLDTGEGSLMCMISRVNLHNVRRLTIKRYKCKYTLT